jgi:hypothetical protein
MTFTESRDINKRKDTPGKHRVQRRALIADSAATANARSFGHDRLPSRSSAALWPITATKTVRRHIGPPNIC